MPTTSPRRRSRRIAAGLATACLAVTMVTIDAGGRRRIAVGDIPRG